MDTERKPIEVKGEIANQDSSSTQPVDKAQFNLDCPICGKLRIFKNQKSVNKSKKYKSVCKNCYQISRIGYKHSDITKQKLSKAHKGMKKPWAKNRISELIKINTGTKRSAEFCKRLSQIHKGRKASVESRKKMSLAHKGYKASNEQRINMSLCKLGKKKTEETKRRMRLAVCERYQKLGIGVGEDKGAKEWFEKYNKETNSNFKPTKFIDAGYYPDGYDKEKHIWIEYDTKYHKLPYQQKKDLVRQNNIIKYFEELGLPLIEFKRVLAYKNEKIITVYKGFQYD